MNPAPQMPHFVSPEKRQPDGAALRHYKLAGFSVERLMNPADGARPGRRDRDSTETPVMEGCADQCRPSL